MPDTNFLNPSPDNFKKPKKKAPRKPAVRKKIDKSPLQFSGDINIKPAMPKASPIFKKTQPAAKKSGAKNIYFKIVLSFAALTIILALLVAYFGFSKATLVIIPTQEKITDSVSLEILDTGAVDPALNQG
ncbi:MAG: hypothetical protein PHS62_04055 [Patescibacteria group bacterium]|nr:hypothetical protein [Patescibacteria group bacterium]